MYHSHGYACWVSRQSVNLTAGLVPLCVECINFRVSKKITIIIQKTKLEIEFYVYNIAQVIPPGMEFNHIVPHDADVDGDAEGSEENNPATPDPPIWSEV